MIKMKIFFLLLLCLVTGIPCASSAQEDESQPDAFVMVHFEAGSDQKFTIYQDIIRTELNLPPGQLTTRSLSYQKALWPTAVQLVELAERYHIKLTLALTPQWAEYILQDEQKIQILQRWKNEGHEIALHHHGISHIDWDGYTGRFQGTVYEDDDKYLEKYESRNYRGSMSEGFSWVQDLDRLLGGNDSVITGTISDVQTDKPDAIKIIAGTRGILERDLISKPSVNIANQIDFFYLTLALLSSNFNPTYDPYMYNDKENHLLCEEQLNFFIEKSFEAQPDESIGIAFHVYDFYRLPDIYEQWFEFIRNRNLRNKTIREIIEDYLGTGLP